MFGEHEKLSEHIFLKPNKFLIRKIYSIENDLLEYTALNYLLSMTYQFLIFN